MDLETARSKMCEIAAPKGLNGPIDARVQESYALSARSHRPDPVDARAHQTEAGAMNGQLKRRSKGR